MADNHPITPPQELLYKWDNLSLGTREIFVIAAQWGADQELEACCEWVRSNGHHGSLPDKLRSIRRPKPPSLKEQALEALDSCSCDDADSWKLIRRALEQLND